jgi:CheY-like chemotaxis protein
MPRVLIIDDDPLLRELLRISLSSAGHIVTEAPDAPSAIRTLLQRDFDVVLTDIEMPYMDGLELAAAIRGDTKTKHIPVVVLSGRNDDLAWQQAKFLGVSAYLNKPVKVDELLRAIGKAIRSAGGETTTDAVPGVDETVRVSGQYCLASASGKRGA